MADAIGAVAAKAFDAIEAKASQIGDSASSLAAGRNLEGVGKAANAAANTIGQIPVVGSPAAAALKALTAVTNAAVGTMNAFADRGRELSAYDGRLAAATANADVRRLQGDIREAKVLGEKMSKLIDKQAEMEDTIREMLLPVKEFIIDVLLEFIEYARSFMTGVLEMFKHLPGVNEEWADRMIRKLREPKPVDSTINFEQLYRDLNSLLPGVGMFDPRVNESPSLAPILDIG